jgi:hypothetical protein
LTFPCEIKYGRENEESEEEQGTVIVSYDEKIDSNQNAQCSANKPHSFDDEK